MKISKKVMGCVSVAVLAAGLLIGCGSKEQELVEITLMHGWGGTESDSFAMRGIYKDFEKENPDIRLNLLSLPSTDEVINKTQDLLSVGEIPDMIFAGGGDASALYRFMVEKDYAVDLMPYLEEDEEFKKCIPETVLNYWTTEDDRLFTLADVLLICGYWYNEDILQKTGIETLPSTWEEFEESCRKIRSWSEQSGEEIYPFMMDAEHIVYLTDVLMSGESEESLKMVQEGSFNLEGEDFRLALRRLKNLYQYSEEVEKGYSYRDTLESFNNGTTAFYINGVWANSRIKENIPAEYAAYPSEIGKSIGCISASIGYIVGNTGDEEKKDACIRFLKYMLSEPTQVRILEETGQVPSNPFVNISDYEKENYRLFQAVERVKQADAAIEMPMNLWDFDTKQIYSDNIFDYLQGKQSEDSIIGKLKETGK